MKDFKVYIVRDSEAITYIVNDDISGLIEALASYLDPELEVATFATIPEALAFCAGLGHNQDERTLPSVYPLRDFEPTDQPYIRLLEN